MLTLKVTEKRKRIPSVSRYTASHVHIGRAVNDQRVSIADQFTTTPRFDIGSFPAEPAARSGPADGGVWC
jgi:hypothetical protein